MKLLDSRRLTGPNLLLDRAGAAIEVSLTAGETEAVVAAWRANARRLLDTVGWTDEETAVRLYPGGASLAVSAPIDGLYAATELNEAAWEGGDLDAAAERLREEVAREANPALLALRDAAAEHGVAFLWDDRVVSVGMGTGSQAWDAEALPEPSAVDWSAVHDVPVLLVTGTNGKTTTVRLLGAIAAAAGRVPGLTSTDRVEVGGEVIERGDFSGPGGARTLLRDRRVEIAILEAARGGMLRRGLATDRADAALITNVAADHLGEFGILDVTSLTEAKLVVARGVKPGGPIVLNADDPQLVAAAGRLSRPVLWFSLEPSNPRLREHLEAGGAGSYLEDGTLMLARGGERFAVVRADEIPVALGGAARHNVANALAAVALASAAGLPVEAMAAGLRSLTSNEGRAALIELGGVHVLLDYAHNPAGIAAIVELARHLPGGRRLLLLGQAGDRDDDAVRDLARAAWPLRPDLIVIKELPEMLRGRPHGEVSALLREELLRLGASPDALEMADDELEGARKLLAQARPGDLLILLAHTRRQEVLDLLERLRNGGWRAGDALPDI